MKMERASHGRRGRTSMRMEVDSSPEREIPGSISTRRVRLPSASKQQQQLQTPVTRPVPARIDTSSLNESEAGRTTYFASHSDAQGSTGDDDSSTEEEAEPADLVRKSPLLRADSIQEVNLSGRGARVLVERSRRSSSALFPDSPSTLSQYLLRSPSPGASSKRPATHSMHTAGHAHTAQVPCSPRAFNTPIHGGGRRFRLDILCEVLILTSAMSLAAFRISSLPISDIIPPAAPLITLTLLMPFITLFRRSAPSTHLMVPFTDERGYRDRNAADDGFPSGVGLPVLLAAGTVWDARVAVQKGQYLQLEGITLLTDIWSSTNPTPSDSPAKILLDARIALLCLTTLNVFVLILHLFLSRTVLRVNWLPLSNTRRFFGALTLSSTLSLLGGAITALFRHFGQASPYVNPLELAISSFIFQMSLYLVSRFARRAFTLGELAMTTATGVSLALEFWRVTRARWLYSKVFLLPATFRSPTPLILYQAALIPGSFLIGFLLSPLLVLSRHIASKPSYRLRWPAEKDRNRKLLAAASLLGTCGTAALFHGAWIAWQLHSGLTSPWSWAARFAAYGGDGVRGMHGELKGWTSCRRLALTVYWLAALFFAVGGWQRRIARTRRRMAMQDSSANASASREDKRHHQSAHFSVDLRRKFFHAIAVIVFVPGIALDPAFTSLAFSLAFCLFTFAEFARYFALYPIGAPIHVFFHQFVDNKDSGPVILSHFYLLTGCAGGLWLEGPGIKRFAGVISLGVGDALASLIGRRTAGPPWPGTSKTPAGTLAFITSTFLFSYLLVLLGLCDPFPKRRYLAATTLTGLLEASSTQNDNLTLPIFFWALQALLEI